MDWYWNLSDLLLNKNKADQSFAGLQDQLEKHVVDLYKKLLSYQMKSVCSYYRSLVVGFLRDLVKLDDWDGTLTDIQHAEAAVQMDSEQYNTQQIRSHLQHLANTAEHNQTRLNDIYSAILDQTKRQEQLRDNIEDRKCLKDLHLTDPRDDKKRIEQTKGGLLKDSYRWILESPAFQAWRDDLESRLLWIKGDPGKGKTMLLCGIIDELKNSTASNGLLSYFFCQATDPRINKATAVLQGLISLLVDQQPSLIFHLRKKYDKAGKELFAGVNAWTALSGVFTDMLHDPDLKAAYLIVDALDECETGLTQLLELVVKSASTSPRVKWIVSSRNWPSIERQLTLSEGAGGVRISLEVNADVVSHAVDVYISHKVSQLKSIMHDDTLQDQVRHQMRQKANGTFLWVALVFKELQELDDAEYEDGSDILKILEGVPSDLTDLYARMMLQIDRLKGNDPERCRAILSTLALAYRPLHLLELPILTGFKDNLTKKPILERLVIKCGSFLTIRDDTVYFVHQSAKEHLIKNTKAHSTIFPFGIESVHRVIFSRSLQAMGMPGTLRRNVYALPHPGLLIDEVNTPDPDPLAAVRYSCVYWINHLCEGSANSSDAKQQNDLDDSGVVSLFLREHFLHWLEALSLSRSISDGVLSITKLEALLRVCPDPV
jgi:hypothetical protein